MDSYNGRSRYFTKPFLYSYLNNLDQLGKIPKNTSLDEDIEDVENINQMIVSQLNFQSIHSLVSFLVRKQQCNC